MAKTKIREEFEYLNRLRESGECNMFDSGKYLQADFDMTRQDARKTVGEWMRWVSENPSNRDL